MASSRHLGRCRHMCGDPGSWPYCGHLCQSAQSAPVEEPSQHCRISCSGRSHPTVCLEPREQSQPEGSAGTGAIVCFALCLGPSHQC